MNVEIGTEAAQFPISEYINGIFVAMYNVQRLQLRPSLYVSSLISNVILYWLRPWFYDIVRSADCMKEIQQFLHILCWK